MKRILPALLLAGCAHWYGPHHPATSTERSYVGAAREAYEAARGPVACPLIDQGVEVVTVAGDGSPCVVPGFSPAPACSHPIQPTAFSAPILAIYLDATLDADGRRYGTTHEALHWLRWCATRDEDARHEDAELWGEIQADAQRRAAVR